MPRHALLFARLARVAVAVPLAVAIGAVVLAGAAPASPSMAFRQAVAEAAYGDEAIAEFYREADYRPIFTGDDADDRRRRAALMAALARATEHGLPASRHAPGRLRDLLSATGTVRARGRAEIEVARLFLAYARDAGSGVLEPGRIEASIKRKLPRRDPRDLLAGIAGNDPHAFLAELLPQSHEYNRLLAARMRLEAARARGGWGPGVSARKLEPGASGPQVVALRDRLTEMGYLERTARRTYGHAVRMAVQRFQIDHGLKADGIAGPETIAALNLGVEERLAQVLVALERERWLNLPGGKGERHVIVNLTDFRARIVDDGRTTFETKAVVGSTRQGKTTPEFSDTMEYMELNPTWTVPRGILKRDYLPKLQSNPGAASYLQVIDARGRVVPRGAVNFSAYTARSFPFNLVQPPGPRNALGTVKFMFPNPHAIYLHDTPEKHLFDRARRTYSSGCIRLNEPHEFAYHLLARQTDTPEETFHSVLRTGAQQRIYLEDPVPVHLVYRTAFATAKGRMNYREDIYGRDARLWDALQAAGVTLDLPQG